MPFSESLRQQTLLSSDVSQMPPDTLTSAYIMPLHRRHPPQHRPERLQRRHFSRQLSVRQRRRASASEAKIPSAEAARAAPVSFIALPRVMASLCRAIASSSKEAAPACSLLVSNANPPFELPQAHPVLAETSTTTSLRTDRSAWMTNSGKAYPGMSNLEEDL